MQYLDENFKSDALFGGNEDLENVEMTLSLVHFLWAILCMGTFFIIQTVHPYQSYLVKHAMLVYILGGGSTWKAKLSTHMR